MNLQPTLTGQLLKLSPLQPEHFDDLYAAASDPLIWEQHPAKNRYEKEVFTAFFYDALDSGGALVVADAKTNKVIGSSRFHGYDECEREVEIGWTFLSRSHWGGTYNGELKHLMLQYAFRFVDRVLFLVGTENLRSQRAVEKLGAVRTGLKPDDAGNNSFVYQLDSLPNIPFS